MENKMNETVAFLKNQLDRVSNEPDGFRVDETFWVEVYNLIAMYEQADSALRALLKTAMPHLIPVGMETSYLTVKLENVHAAHQVIQTIDANAQTEPPSPYHRPNG